MKQLAIITFDICRPGEPITSFAAGSIISSLQSHPTYGYEFELTHHSFNLYESPRRVINWETEPIEWDCFDYIAISCYIWSHELAISLMNWLKLGKYKASIIAGGYQVNSNDIGTLRALYPNADLFVVGYAEKALAEIVLGKTRGPIVKINPTWEELPSPYLSSAINVDFDVTNLRIETKRGCPFACTFCAQHEVGRPQTHFYLPERLEQELEFIKKQGIKRVSVTDPVFNMGSTYIPYLKKIKTLGLNGVFNLQVRPELISTKNDTVFLDLLADTHSEIELGMQTFDEKVNQIIKRKNQYGPIDKTLSSLLERDIKFGISLIYGLPGQTLDSFKKDIDKVTNLGIRNVIAFPLMLLPGTELFALRGQDQIRERTLGDYEIPHVIASSTFSEREWLAMHRLACQLNPSGRIF